MSKRKPRSSYSPKKSPRKGAKASSWFKKILFALFLLLLLSGLGFLVLCYQYLEGELADISQLHDAKLPMPMKIYTADNKLMAEFGEIRSTPVTYEQIPTKLVQAVVATEDQNFFEHGGVDFMGLCRASVELLLTGTKSQGGSTITMQVARNFYLSREKTFARKLNEILLARKIDEALTKKQIMALYLNKIYLGNRAYGVSAAAQVYYGVPLNQLSLAQLAMIAGLPKAPSSINPIANPVAAKKRRNHVLARMRELGYIDKEEYLEALSAPVTTTYHGLKIEVNAPYVAEMVRSTMLNQYGNAAYTHGFRVYTTIDSKQQLAANQALTQALINYDRRHGYRGVEANLGKPEKNSLIQWREKLREFPTRGGVRAAAVIDVKPKSITTLIENGDIVTISADKTAWTHKGGDLTQWLKPGDVVRVLALPGGGWDFSQVPKVEGALVALNPINGAITALVGGFGYSSGNFNRVTQGYRQPGSSFKPFIYSSALARGFTLASVFNDAPIVINDPSMDHPWRPQNDKGEYSGPMRLREALVRSRNLVSIRVLAAVGSSYAIEYASRFGFELHKMPYGLSLALGTALVTPLEMAAGYAVFANGGYHVTPFIIDRINDEQDQVVYQAHPKVACVACISDQAPRKLPEGYAPAVITAQNAFMMDSAMQDVIRRGTGRGALVLGRSDLAGKTGTTNDKMDAWFSGFNSDLVATVWVGFDQPQPLKEYGAQAALPLWNSFMEKALQGKPFHQLAQPPGVVSVLIDPKTGLKARPNQSNAVSEYFLESKVPTAVAPLEQVVESTEDAQEAESDLSAEPVDSVEAAAVSATAAQNDEEDTHLF
ncbi:MAG: penicillin-binding protein 1A [Gammaproteobacteria bacterium]|nr:penicillin-binding protein 1A [Gammaproteobacteria bacterium]